MAKLETLLFFLLLCSCEVSTPIQSTEKILFQAVGNAGVESVNLLNPTEEFNIITYLYYYNGGGVAATDINGDGLPDLYFTNNQAPNKYYINQGNWQFKDATEEAGVAGKMGWSTGVSVVDVNDDGLADIYVCGVSDYLELQSSNELFVQQSNGTFVESAAKYGLDFAGFSTQSYWLDYDQDGDQDMFLLCHSVHNDATYGPAKFRNRPDERAGDRLYRRDQRADGSIFFTEINPQDSGLYSSKIGYGLSAAVADFDGNGWPDIYVCNDFSENDYLYLNQGGKFVESVRTSMGHTSNFSMGSDVGDFDHDGRPDLFTLDMRPSDHEVLKHTANADAYNVYDIKRNLGYYHQYPRNNLQWNRGNGQFSEIAQLAGVEASDWSWSALIADYNLDGQEDIYVSNGIWRRPNDLDYLKFISNEQKASEVTNLELAEQMPDGQVANQVFAKEYGLEFIEKGKEWGLDLVGSSSGSAYADFDQDGDLDLVVNNLNAPAVIYRNTTIEDTLAAVPLAVPVLAAVGYSATRFGDEYLQIKGTTVAAPVTVTVHFVDGSERRRYFATQRGFQSQSEAVWTILIPSSTEVERISVNEPFDDGNTLARETAKDGRYFGTLNTLNALPPLRIASVLVEENEYTDFDVEPLQPFTLSQEGPAAALGMLNDQEVLFVGGAHGKPAQLLLANEELTPLAKKLYEDILNDSLYEDVDATFFDADGDGDDDLYVVSGGGQANSPIKYFADRIYLNENGRLVSCDDCLINKAFNNGSCVLAHDFDSDGDLDLFVGGRGIPGQYGQPGFSEVLLNDGSGQFIPDPLWEAARIGMVTDAIWFEDGKQLIVAGEWMPITLLKREKPGWQKKEIKGSNGLWRCLVATDGGFFWAGNWGENSALGEVSANSPFKLYLSDVDNNGRIDPLITQIQNGKEYLFADKDEISAQIPGWRRNNLSYHDFAARTFQENFPDVEFDEPLLAETFSSAYYRYANGEVHKVKGGELNTMSCTNDFLPLGKAILVAGNSGAVLPRLGQQDAAALQLVVEREDWGGFHQLIPWAGGNNGVVKQLLQTSDGLIIAIGRKGE